MCNSIKEARRQQTQREIERLIGEKGESGEKGELKTWFDKRVTQDTNPVTNQYRGQYDSQLKAIFNEVNGAAQIISQDLEGVVLGDLSLGDVYTRCAQADRRMVWLWRVFNFFRDKFDQRDDPVMGDTLRAADEVVWSCYRPFFQSSKTENRREPPPLPYIAAEYSPAAVRRDQTPGSLLKKGKDFEPLQKYLEKLPIPILQLPPNSITAPWTLVLIGHEVGHFIQPVIQQNFAYVKSFSSSLQQAVKQAGGSSKDQERWKNWAPEIFADWYSVLCMGQWAVWVMAQFEIQDEATMLKERSSYPSPIARLALLAELADAYVPGEGSKMLNQLGLNPKQMALDHPEATDLSFVEEVARAVRQPLPDGLGGLDNLLAFRAKEFEAAGEVDKRSDALLSKKPRDIKRELRKARLIAASASQAWAKIMQMTDTQERETAAGELRAALKDIIDCAPPDVRAAPASQTTGPNAGDELAQLLGEIAETEEQEPPDAV